MGKKVTIYSTPSCIYCKMAKDFFKRKGIEYTEYNVGEDEKAREEMMNKSHQLGVPVIIVDGEVFVGFSRPELEKALSLK